MAISIVILENESELSLDLGPWDSIEEAQKWYQQGGDDEKVIALEKYHGQPNSPNCEIFEAMAASASYADSIGSDLQEFAQFVFALGRKVER